MSSFANILLLKIFNTQTKVKENAVIIRAIYRVHLPPKVLSVSVEYPFDSYLERWRVARTDRTSHTEMKGNKILLCICVDMRIAVIVGCRERGHRSEEGRQDCLDKSVIHHEKLF